MKEKVRKIGERPTVQRGHLYARNGKPKRNTWMAAPTFDGEFAWKMCKALSKRIVTKSFYSIG
jgi:hypothetical protein